uniref:Uncharacterized protein n=1 Tax=Anguilla anguilla TaxID=7936 RepID=A0A0E9RVF5_ANGAN
MSPQCLNTSCLFYTSS